jgi:hypothetical protein
VLDPGGGAGDLGQSVVHLVQGLLGAGRGQPEQQGARVAHGERFGALQLGLALQGAFGIGVVELVRAAGRGRLDTGAGNKTAHPQPGVTFGQDAGERLVQDRVEDVGAGPRTVSRRVGWAAAASSSSSAIGRTPSP